MADQGPERTPDGRWIVVGGRRWRASDPSIPDALRTELVDELMGARRAVGAARRRQDEAAEAAARSRVQDAKVALGERGEPWWEPTTDVGRRRRIAATVRALAGHRAEGTICPSDAARAAGGPGWRDLMGTTREVVRDLAAVGEVEVLQRGTPVPHGADWHGPVRIRSAGGRPSRGHTPGRTPEAS